MQKRKQQAIKNSSKLDKAEPKKRQGRPQKQTRSLDEYTVFQFSHSKRSRDAILQAKPHRGRPWKLIKLLDTNASNKLLARKVTSHNVIAHSQAHLPRRKTQTMRPLSRLEEDEFTDLNWPVKKTWYPCYNFEVLDKGNTMDSTRKYDSCQAGKTRLYLGRHSWSHALSQWMWDWAALFEKVEKETRWNPAAAQGSHQVGPIWAVSWEAHPASKCRCSILKQWHIARRCF